MKEIWKDIPNYEGVYQVSTYGRVKNIKTKRILKLYVNVNGYKTLRLSKNGKVKNFRVHKIVAITFISNPNEHPIINHKNGIKIDNRVCNLEWCTYSINTIHAYGTGLQQNKNTKVNQYDLSGKYIKTWKSQTEASINLNISQSSISYCCQGKRKRAGKYRWSYNNKEMILCQFMKKKIKRG